MRVGAGAVRIVDVARRVTGGSQGIGLATVSAFLRAQWSVVCVARTPCPVDGVRSVLVDLSDIDALHNALPGVVGHLTATGATCLIHNAARLNSDDASRMDAATLRAALDVNVVAPAVLNAAIIPRMTPGSSVLFVGSTLSEKAVPRAASYVTSKHAVVGLMRATCQDLAGTGIHTVCVCPGFVDTDMMRSHIARDPALLTGMLSSSTQNRLVRADEIADLLLVCATSPALNGSVVHANSGQRER
jgi:3-oxoacyl-[acyl-carrier protein] reductase